jgi:hypothetical protein
MASNAKGPQLKKLTRPKACLSVCLEILNLLQLANKFTFFFNPVQCGNLLCEFFFSVVFSPQPLSFVDFPRLLILYRPIYSYPPHLSIVGIHIGARFSTPVQTGPAATQPPVQWVPDLSRG